MPTVMHFPPGYVAYLSPIQANSSTESRAWLFISKLPIQRLVPRLHPRKAHSKGWEFSGAEEHIQDKYLDSYRRPSGHDLGSSCLWKYGASQKGNRRAWQASWYRLAAATPTITDNTIHDGLLNSQDANPQPLAPQAERAQWHLTELLQTRVCHIPTGSDSWAHWDNPGGHTH